MSRLALSSMDNLQSAAAGGPGRAYLRELSAPGVEALMTRWLTRGDQGALEALVERVLPAVHEMARTQAVRESMRNDLIQEATLGLLRALHHYDSDGQVPLATFAARWVRAAMRRYLLHGAEPRGERQAVAELVEPTNPADAVEEEEFAHKLRARLSAFEATLEGRRLEMFRDRVVAETAATLQELADRWGVSREAVRRIERGVVEPLRRYLSRELSDSLPAALGTA